jgi:general secretion pathway protein H
MTSPTERDAADAGFTLIEMIVVLVILAVMAGLVVARGPMHSATLDLRVAAENVARAMRAAQARAIATDRSVQFTLDAARHAYRINAPPGGIRFAPDGSSTGGEIELVSGSRHIRIMVSWLTGRVSVLDGA